MLHSEMPSSVPISIPADSIKSHLHRKRHAGSEESHSPIDDAEMIMESVDDEDYSLPNSLESTISSSLDSLLFLQLASSLPFSTSRATYPPPSATLSKRASFSQILKINVITSAASGNKTDTRCNLTRLLQKEEPVASEPRSVLQKYLGVDSLPEIFRFRRSAVGAHSNDAQALGHAETSNATPPLTPERESFLLRLSISGHEPLMVSRPQRNRELRINSKFLIMYSLDYSSRLNHYLPTTQSPSEVAELVASSKALHKFHCAYDLNKISLLSRDKLWANVVLLARHDALPLNHVEYKDYIRCGSNLLLCLSCAPQRGHSIIKLDGEEYLPWSHMDSTQRAVKPAGVLQGSSTLCNSDLPSSGLSRSQFTVKGWCNKRWVSAA